MPSLFYKLISPLLFALAVIGAMRTPWHSPSNENRNFSRDISQPKDVIADALDAVDVVNQPQTRAMLSQAEEGHPPQILARREADGLSWTILNGDKAVVRMKATLSAGANGATHVETKVEPGGAQAPADLPKVFTSQHEMESLFAVAVERALFPFIPQSERSSYSQQGHSSDSASSTAEASRYDPPPADPHVQFDPGKPMINPTVH